MHDMRALLNELLKEYKPWDWTAKCQEVFEKIKKTLMSELFLTHYNPDLEIIVASDAISYGIGACILHKMTDGILKSIAHVSRALLPVEKNLFTNRKRGSWEFQSSTTIFMVDTSLNKQTTSHYSLFLADCRDGVQSC